MAAAIRVDRARWLGYRWRGHGLDGKGDDVLDDLLLLGFQDSRQEGSAQSLIQRVGSIDSTGVAAAIGPRGPLVSWWSVRGAPHAHRIAQLDVVRDALAPRPSDDGGAAYVEAVQQVADALSAVVTRPMSKGEASGAERVSASVVEWCPGCQAHNVPRGYSADRTWLRTWTAPSFGRARVSRGQRQQTRHPSSLDGLRAGSTLRAADLRKSGQLNTPERS